MTINQRILLSVGLLVLVIALGLACVWYITEHPIPGVRGEDRAAKLGSAAAVLLVIIYAALWLPVAARIGKQRRAELEKHRTRKRRRQS